MHFVQRLLAFAFVSLSIALIVLIFFAGEVIGQKKTILLIRHAEKDVSSAADANDPGLTAEGVSRADRFAMIAKRYRPGAVYSTNFKRTMLTAGPIAKRRGLTVRNYDPKDHAALVKEIMTSKTKRFVVIGHSNTVPALANALIKKELFKNLDDAEYGAIWIIRLRDGQGVKTEIVPF